MRARDTLAAILLLCCSCDSAAPLQPDTGVDAALDATMDVGLDGDAAVDADAAGADQGLTVSGFVRIVAGGVDDRLNGYPWAMELFDGDQDGTPEVYVGTVQNPLCLQVGLAGWLGLSPTDSPPPARWQCRNDLWGAWVEYFAASRSPGHVYRGKYDQATQSWSFERVFSPSITETSGFRGARVFDDALYMLGVNTSGGVVWKTTDGESFEKASPANLAPGNLGIVGGLRGAQVFTGKLYVANNGLCEIYASAKPSTDPGSWEKVNSTGFLQSGGPTNAQGSPSNTGIWQLGVFDGHLYAGTTNAADGHELWKSSDPKPGNWTRVIEGGFGNTVPQGFMTIRPFGKHLYLGTVLYPVGATGFEGCDILRVDATDTVELLVGKTRDKGGPNEVAPLSKMAGGFDYPPNLYSWYMAEHNGWLYVGTYDAGSQAIDYAEEIFNLSADKWTETHRSMIDAVLGTTDRARQGGADLWRTQDGVTWEAVNLDGFGDRDNYGIRNLLSTPWGLMVGTGNAVDGFEIWLAPE